MSLFDKAREAMGKAAAAVSREAEVIALQSQLGNTDTELDRVLVEVGKRARELYRAGQLEDRELGVLMRRVEELEEQMMELRRKVQEAQSSPAPAAPVPPPPPPQPETTAPTRVCPGCDRELSVDAAFCSNCGAKL